jgi:hypothetical protein
MTAVVNPTTTKLANIEGEAAWMHTPRPTMAMPVTTHKSYGRSLRLEIVDVGLEGWTGFS